MRQTLRPSNLAIILLAGLAAWMIIMALQPKPQPHVHLGASPAPTTTVNQPTEPSSLWIGDAYTAGTGASGQDKAESCMTSTAMGWICNVDAEAGTGFVNSGNGFQPVRARLQADHSQYLADVVILDAGRADVAEPAPTLRPAIAAAFRRIAFEWPKARLVVIDPYLMTSTSELNPALTAELRRETKRYHGIFIDPIKEGWISRPKTKAHHLTDDQANPNPAGHRYIANHLVADFKQEGLSDLAITDDLGSR